MKNYPTPQTKGGRSSNFGQQQFLPVPGFVGFPNKWLGFTAVSKTVQLALDEIPDQPALDIVSPREVGEWGIALSVTGIRSGGVDSFGNALFNNTFLPSPVFEIEFGSGGAFHRMKVSAGQVVSVPGINVKVTAYWQQLSTAVATEWNAGPVSPPINLEGVWVAATLQRTFATRSPVLSLMTMLGKPTDAFQENNRTLVPPFAQSVRFYRGNADALSPPTPLVYGAAAFYGACPAPSGAVDYIDTVTGAAELQKLVGNAWSRPVPKGAQSVVVNLDAGAQLVRGIAEYTLQI